MAKFWDKETDPQRIERSSRGDEIQVRKVSKGQSEFIDIRTWFRDQANVLQPGKGIAIPIDLVDEVISAVQTCQRM